MSEAIAAQLLPIVDRLYSAAAREITLDDAFSELADLLGDFVAAMFVHDPIMGDTTLEACVGIDRAWVTEYNTRWGSSNPLVLRSLGDLMAGKIINSDHVMPWSELSATAYGQEFFGAIGARYSLSALVAGQAQRYASYVTARAESAGAYTDWHYAVVEALRHHLGRTLHILEFFEGARLSLHLFRSSMDHLPFSVMLLDDRRRIIYANARAGEMLQAGTVLAEEQGVLAARPDRRRFEEEWARMTANPLACSAFIPLFADDSTLRVEASRISVASGIVPSGRLWMLRVNDEVLDPAELAREWKILYGMTAAESRVATALIRDGDGVATGRALGLSENTVRAHLKHMFAKTGTRSQAALVLRLALHKSIGAPTAN